MSLTPAPTVTLVWRRDRSADPTPSGRALRLTEHARQRIRGRKVRPTLDRTVELPWSHVSRIGLVVRQEKRFRVHVTATAALVVERRTLNVLTVFPLSADKLATLLAHRLTGLWV